MCVAAVGLSWASVSQKIVNVCVNSAKCSFYADDQSRNDSEVAQCHGKVVGTSNIVLRPWALNVAYASPTDFDAPNLGVCHSYSCISLHWSSENCSVHLVQSVWNYPLLSTLCRYQSFRQTDPQTNGQGASQRPVLAICEAYNHIQGCTPASQVSRTICIVGPTTCTSSAKFKLTLTDPCIDCSTDQRQTSLTQHWLTVTLLRGHGTRSHPLRQTIRWSPSYNNWYLAYNVLSWFTQ